MSTVTLSGQPKGTESHVHGTYLAATAGYAHLHETYMAHTYACFPMYRAAVFGCFWNLK